MAPLPSPKPKPRTQTEKKIREGKNTCNFTMVDVDRRTTQTLTSHSLALRRLSLRASASTSSSTHLPGTHSFSTLVSSLISSLSSANIPLSPGLSPSELALIESSLSFSFPPDLRALLSSSLPLSHGFPDWRSFHNTTAIDFPIAAISLQIARNSFWPKSWGPRPADPSSALKHARSALKRAPLLIPVFHRCYIPSLPCLAGNPIFFVDDDEISLCGLDLSDFFTRFVHGTKSISRSVSLPRPGPERRRRARWVEFWSDAAACDRRRRSSSSTSDPERFVEIRMVKMPAWVGDYLGEISNVLKNGGWNEMEISEMVEVVSSNCMELDGEAVMDALVMKADRCSDDLRRAGWRSEEVEEVLGSGFGVMRGRRRKVVELPERVRVKMIGKLAEVISRS